MRTLLFGFISFVSLVIGLLGFRRDNMVLGWIGVGGFILCLLAAVIALWNS